MALQFATDASSENGIRHLPYDLTLFLREGNYGFNDHAWSLVDRLGSPPHSIALEDFNNYSTHWGAINDLTRRANKARCDEYRVKNSKSSPIEIMGCLSFGERDSKATPSKQNHDEEKNLIDTFSNLALNENFHSGFMQNLYIKDKTELVKINQKFDLAFTINLQQSWFYNSSLRTLNWAYYPAKNDILFYNKKIQRFFLKKFKLASKMTKNESCYIFLYPILDVIEFLNVLQAAKKIGWSLDYQRSARLNNSVSNIACIILNQLSQRNRENELLMKQKRKCNLVQFNSHNFSFLVFKKEGKTATFDKNEALSCWKEKTLKIIDERVRKDSILESDANLSDFLLLKEKKKLGSLLVQGPEIHQTYFFTEKFNDQNSELEYNYINFYMKIRGSKKNKFEKTFLSKPTIFHEIGECGRLAYIFTVFPNREYSLISDKNNYIVDLFFQKILGNLSVLAETEKDFLDFFNKKEKERNITKSTNEGINFFAEKTNALNATPDIQKKYEVLSDEIEKSYSFLTKKMTSLKINLLKYIKKDFLNNDDAKELKGIMNEIFQLIRFEKTREGGINCGNKKTILYFPVNEAQITKDLVSNQQYYFLQYLSKNTSAYTLRKFWSKYINNELCNHDGFDWLEHYFILIKFHLATKRAWSLTRHMCCTVDKNCLNASEKDKKRLNRIKKQIKIREIHFLAAMNFSSLPELKIENKIKNVLLSKKLNAIVNPASEF